MQQTQETWIRSLGREDPLEKEMATPSSILAWEIPWTEEPSGLQAMGSWKNYHDWVTKQQLPCVKNICRSCVLGQINQRCTPTNPDSGRQHGLALPFTVLWQVTLRSPDLLTLWLGISSIPCWEQQLLLRHSLALHMVWVVVLFEFPHPLDATCISSFMSFSTLLIWRWYPLLFLRTARHSFGFKFTVCDFNGVLREK